MPVVTVLLPSLHLGSRFSGVCMHKVAKKIALYFVAPFGVMSNMIGYPQHKNERVVAANLTGVTSVVLAATWRPIAAYRNVANFGGCALMLSSSYYGNKIAKEKGNECCHCCN